jgi:hypothetical protein
MKMPEKRSKKRINEIHRNRIFIYLFFFLNQDDNTGSPKTTQKKNHAQKRMTFIALMGQQIGKISNLRCQNEI